LSEVRPNQRGEALVEINFRILGPTALRIGDQFDQEWAQPKPRGMLAALLLRPRQALTVDELVSLMWPSDKIPREPAATLYSYVKRIRDGLDQMSDPPKIRVAGGTYRIDVDRAKVDFFAFRSLIIEADSLRRQGDHAGAARLLAEAVDLWDGQAFTDLQGERAVNRRLSAEKEHLIPAHGALLTELCALGSYEDVLRRYADLPADCQETLAVVKCRLESLRGLHRYQEATAYYLDQRKRLMGDVDEDSAAELTRFHNDIRTRKIVSPGMETPRLLPRDISDFTGRKEFLDHLDMIEAQVTVLVGEPGVGKTALALHWAHQVADRRFPDGQLYVDLRGFGSGVPAEPAEVAETFLVALGYPATRIPNTAGKLSRLRSLLAGRNLLVILDNAGAPQHVQQLIDCMPSCLVLITSRRRLSGLGLTLPIPPLTYPESKNLLARRLGNRVGAEPSSLSQLVELCGGIAMVLRVVAEHVNSRPRVPLIEFVEELRDGRTLLGLGDSGYGQDGSVRAAFSRSYQALGDDEQRGFRLLGLNPGSDISVDAAAALTGLDRRTTQRSLDILVDAYLLDQPESRERYRLHDLLRKYAQECVADPAYENERAAAGERLLSFYLHTTSNADMLAFPGRDEVPLLALAGGVRPLSFVDADSAIKWIVRERANLNAIVRFAAASGFHEYATRLPSSVGEIFLKCHYYADVSAALCIAVDSAREANDIDREATSLGNLGFIYLTLHDLVMAERYLLLAQAKFDEVDNPHGVAVNMHRIGRLQVEQGKLKEGIQTQLDALALQRRTGRPGSVMISLYRLAEAYRRAHNFSAAMSCCDAALRQAREVGDRHNEVLCLVELALTHYERGDPNAAEEICDAGLRLSAEIHETGQLGRYYNLLAMICRDRGNALEAERLSRIALDRSHAARDAKSEGAAWDTIAEIVYKQARTEEALECWMKALTAYEDCGDPRAISVRARIADSTAFPSSVPRERTEPLVGRSTHSMTEKPPLV
jgi:tetratricopeptide (TPR) repeat protein/DNA-binding SARP family transcriptional activator